MSVKITSRSIGDVTILDCVGRITLGDGASHFRDAMRALVYSGRKKIILNYSEVSYIDSSGLGELISAFTTVTNNGGGIVLLNLTRRVKDLIQIEKLYTVFEIFDDEAVAVRRLEVSPLHCLCPICGARSSPALLDTSGWAPQTCGNCNARFSVAASAERPTEELIERVQLPTYPEEYIEVQSGAPFKIRVAGRLSLFTSAGLTQIWRSLPARIALFDLRAVTEVTPEGEACVAGAYRSAP
jgi:anti-sigma B factor antagonist